MSRTAIDQPEFAALAARARQALGWADTLDVRTGAPERNDFSITFWITNGATSESVYVKLPRHQLLFDRSAPIFPPSERDRVNARAEFESLTRLRGVLTASPVRFVEPRAYLEADAGFITTRAGGPDAFRDFQRWETSAARGDHESASLLERHLADVGRMLAAVHASESTATEFALVPLQQKLRALSEWLVVHGAGAVALRRVPTALATHAAERAETRATWAIKGIDVRNLLWDGTRLVSLDPGAMKRSVREADLARFLMTLRILYWGDLSFLSGRQPGAYVERAVLAGYGFDPNERRLLDWFLLKETLKHWRMAYLTIDVKSWPWPMKQAARRFYVDRFYDAELGRLLAVLDA